MGSLNLLYLIQMALGIGLVIFVHEAGHFLAARLCGVRVEVFSLGFGPSLLSWTRGDTRYQIALLPIGGFCRMTGEEPDERGAPPATDDLRSKSVGQRFLIFSGGVIMNVIFALVVFPVILFYGVPFIPPVIGEADPGGPAWHADLEPGTRVLSVNGHPTIGFMYIAHQVALGPPDEAVLEVVPPGATAPSTVVVHPHYDEDDGFSSIRVRPPLAEDTGIEVQADGPAWRAGMRSGDRLVSIDTDLPELPLRAQLQLAMQDGAPMRAHVRRGTADLDLTIEPEADPETARDILGVGPLLDRVVGLRGTVAGGALGLRESDVLRTVNGRPIRRPLDLERALVAGDGPLAVVVEREGRRLELTGPTLDRAGALALADDIALDGDFDSSRVVITPGSAAQAAGLQDGDELVKIDDAPVGQWSEIQDHTRGASAAARPMTIDVRRGDPAGGESRLLRISAATDSWSSPSYGFGVRTASYVYRAASVREAFTVGVQGSWKFLVDAWNTVKRILLGQVSSKNVGGIISISVVSYSWASLGLAKLLFFLCMLSMNLAFLNVLPIPVLDGGHLLFLLIEKLTGSPVSERVFGYSQMVGMVLILSLMIYVTYNDLVRWVPGLFGG